MSIKKKTINVLLINDHLGWDGTVMHGVGKLFLQWIRAFDNDKFKITLCILRSKDALAELFENENIKIRFLGRKKYHPLALMDILKIIRQDQIDVIHVQGYGATNFVRIAKVLTGVPVLVHFHDTLPYYPRVQRIADWVLSRFTDAAIAVSESAKDYVCQHRCIKGLNQDRIQVIHNSVSIDEFQMPDTQSILRQKERFGIKKESKIVGTVTRLFHTKGNHYFLEAASDVLKVFPETYFVIVGDGPLRKELEQLSSYLGIQDRVVFTGFINKVPELLATFDVKVSTSWAAEGTPLAILEAMAMGKAIVATDILEIIEDGVTGLVVPRKNSKILAKKILCLLENKEYAQQLGRAAQLYCKQHDVGNYVRRLEKIYESLVSQSKPYSINVP